MIQHYQVAASLNELFDGSERFSVWTLSSLQDEFVRKINVEARFIYDHTEVVREFVNQPLGSCFGANVSDFITAHLYLLMSKSTLYLGVREVGFFE